MNTALPAFDLGVYWGKELLLVTEQKTKTD